MITPIQTQHALLAEFSQLQQIASASPVADSAVAASAEVNASSGISTDFAATMRSINQAQNQASALMSAVDAGRSDDLVGAMVASQKADLSFSMLLQIRNKVMNGVDDIMRMSL